VQYKIIAKKGGWFGYPEFPNEKHTIQGKDNVVAWFKENDTQYQALRKQVETQFKNPQPVAAQSETDIPDGEEIAEGEGKRKGRKK